MRIAPCSLALLAAIVVLAVLPTPAQTVTQVTKTGNNDWDVNPVLSQDGRMLAWVRRAPQGTLKSILVADTWKKTVTTLSPSVTAIERLCMSGDGQTLFYLYVGRIWAIPSGGGPAKVVRSPGPNRSPNRNAMASSYDGQTLCYSTWGGGRAGLEVLDVATGTRTDVTKRVPFTPHLVSGDLSGDGKTVVFTAHSSTRTDLWFAGVDGTLINRIHTGPSTTTAYNPKIDRRGTICAYESVVGGVYAIFSSPVRTTLRYPTSPGSLGPCRGPMMAGNGDRVTWMGMPKFDQSDIFLAHPEGSGFRSIIPSAGLNISTTPFSLHTVNGDGTVAAFCTLADFGGNPEYDWEIYLWRDALTRSGVARPGQTVSFHMEDASRGGAVYLARCSLGRSPGLPLPGVGRIPLNPDVLFHLSGLAPDVFRNMNGILDPQGLGTYHVAIPRIPVLRGIAFFTSFVTVRQTVAVYPAVKVVIQ